MKPLKFFNKIITIIFTILLILSIIVVNTTIVNASSETIWRHSGFELTKYDLNFSFMNATNIWTMTFAQNGTDVPPLSPLNKATLYYDASTDTVKVSENGGVYKTAFGGSFVNKSGDTMTGALNITNGGLWIDGTTGATPTSGAGTRFMWIPGKGALRAGVVTNNIWDAANIGTGSIALGRYTKASGTDDVAIGYGSFATGGNSMALGYGALASNNLAFAAGNQPIASGDSSVAIGDSAQANGQTSIAIGSLAIANNQFSTAMGRKMSVSGDYSFGINLNNVACVETEANVFSICGGSYKGNAAELTNIPAANLTGTLAPERLSNSNRDRYVQWDVLGVAVQQYGKIILPNGTIISGFVSSVEPGDINVSFYRQAWGNTSPTSANHLGHVQMYGNYSVKDTILTNFTSVNVAEMDMLVADVTSVSGITNVTFGIIIRS